jgi:hypothetical protein
MLLLRGIGRAVRLRPAAALFTQQPRAIETTLQRVFSQPLSTKAALRRVYQPGERWWWFLRALRVSRSAALVVAIYTAGRSAGSMDALTDPEGMRNQLIAKHIERTFIPSDRSTQPRMHPPSSSMQRRLSQVGTRILAAAREHIAAQRVELGATIKRLQGERVKIASRGRSRLSDEELDMLLETEARIENARAAEADWAEAAGRLNGHWNWVVTNSSAVNVRRASLHCAALHRCAPARCVSTECVPWVAQCSTGDK